MPPTRMEVAWGFLLAGFGRDGSSRHGRLVSRVEMGCSPTLCLYISLIPAILMNQQVLRWINRFLGDSHSTQLAVQLWFSVLDGSSRRPSQGVAMHSESPKVRTVVHQIVNRFSLHACKLLGDPSAR